VSARDTWIAGSLWRVVREGASLSGMTPGDGPWMRGWGRDLAVGEVVVCLGIHSGWGSDPVPEAHFATEDSIEARASFVNILPQGGMWQAWPVDGYLERIEEAEKNSFTEATP
jgi:hypothetical protein